MASKKHKTLYITTDFGDNLAPAQLHAVIDRLGFSGKIIDNHTTAAFAIHVGAFEMALLAKYASDGSVHLGVIDPGVGSERAGIIIKSKKYWFVGPDNGLLFPAASENGIEKVWKINENFFPDVTRTFHGRDVFIKSAVHLAMGKLPNEFGCTLMNKTDIIPLSFTNGQVLHVDAYGNLKVYSNKSLEVNSNLKIKQADREFTVPVVTTFDDVNVGEALAYEGSSKTLELAINQGSFAEKYKIDHQDVLSIEQI